MSWIFLQGLEKYCGVCPFFMVFYYCLSAKKTASVEDFLFWNPNCSLFNSLFLLMWSIIWEKSFSRSLAKVGVNEIGR